MMIDELIEKLYELKREREYGDREVQLFTQDRNRGWDVHDVDEVYFSEDGKIVIEGKRKTECEE